MSVPRVSAASSRAVGRREHARARVVGRVDDDHPRARRHRAAQGRPVDPIARHRERNGNRRRAGEPHRGNVAVVGRLEDDDFVAGMRERADGREDRLRRAGGDGNLVLGVVAVAVEALHLAGDRLAQRHDAGAQRILVVPRAHRRGDEVDQHGIDRVIREPLPEVDGTVLLRERRHHAEDGGARRRQPRANVEGGAGAGDGGHGGAGGRRSGCAIRARARSRARRRRAVFGVNAAFRGRCDNEHTKTAGAEGGMGDGTDDRPHRGGRIPAFRLSCRSRRNAAGRARRRAGDLRRQQPYPQRMRRLRRRWLPGDRAGAVRSLRARRRHRLHAGGHCAGARMEGDGRTRGGAAGRRRGA